MGFFWPLVFFFIFYFIAFVIVGKGTKLHSQLSSFTVYDLCTKIQFFEEQTMGGVNTRLPPCVGIPASYIQSFVAVEQCHLTGRAEP